MLRGAPTPRSPRSPSTRLLTVGTTSTCPSETLTGAPWPFEPSKKQLDPPDPHVWGRSALLMIAHSGPLAEVGRFQRTRDSQKESWPSPHSNRPCKTHSPCLKHPGWPQVRCPTEGFVWDQRARRVARRPPGGAAGARAGRARAAIHIEARPHTRI